FNRLPVRMARHEAGGDVASGGKAVDGASGWHGGFERAGGRIPEAQRVAGAEKGFSVGRVEERSDVAGLRGPFALAGESMVVINDHSDDGPDGRNKQAEDGEFAAHGWLWIDHRMIGGGNRSPLQ